MKREHCRRSIVAVGFFTLIALLAGCGTGHRSADSPPPSQATQPAPAGRASVFPAAWTQYRFSDQHTGVVYQPGTQSYRWTAHVNDSLFTDATVVNGLVYVGSMGNSVYCFDARTGRLVWSYKAVNWIMTEPVVVNGRVFVASGNRYYQLQKGWDPSIAIRGSGANAVYALDARTGKVIWKFVTRGGNMPTPVYANGIVYLVGGDRMVYAFDANTGWLRWQLPIPSIVSMSSPVLAGNLLVFGGGYPNALYAVNVRTQQVQWVQPTPGTGGLTDAPPAVANGVIYITAYSSRGLKKGAVRAYEYAVRLSDGHMLWTSNLGLGAKVVDNSSGATEVVGNALYFGHPEVGAFFSLDAATGKIRWRFVTHSKVIGGAAVIGSKVYFADSAGILYVLNAATGKQLLARKLTGPVMPGGVTVVGTTLYVPTRTGYVQAIPLASLG